MAGGGFLMREFVFLESGGRFFGDGSAWFGLFIVAGHICGLTTELARLPA